MIAMNIAIRTSTRWPFLPATFVLITLACFGHLPQMQAGLPPEIPGNPDGCYPAFTTAEGCNALALLGSGIGNTAIGWYSLFLVGDASFNTGVGAGALALTTTGADSNTAVGAAALLLNTTGVNNTAFGTSTPQLANRRCSVTLMAIQTPPLVLGRSLPTIPASPIQQSERKRSLA